MSRKNKKKTQTALAPHPAIKRLNSIIIASIILMLVGVTITFNIKSHNIVGIKAFLNYQLTYFALYLFFVASYIRGKFIFERAEPLIPLILFLLWGVFSLLITFFKYSALEEINRFYSYTVLSILIVQVFSEKRQIKWAINTFLLLIAASVIYVTFQDLGMDFIEWGMNVHVAFFGNPNFYSGYITTTIGILYSLYFYLIISEPAKKLLRSNKKTGPVTFTFIFLVIFPILILYVFSTITARAAVIGALAGFILCGILLQVTGRLKEIKEIAKIFFRNKYARKTLLWVACSMLLFFLLFYFLSGAVQDSVNNKVIRLENRISSVFQIKHGTNKSRLVMYLGTLNAIENMSHYPFGSSDNLRAHQIRGLIKFQPLVGYGIGSFQKLFPFHRPNFYHYWGVSHNSMHAHNEYLEILSEEGIIGLALFLLFLTVFFKYTIGNIKKIRDKYLQIIQIGLLAGIVGTLAHNLLSVNLRWTSSAVPFWMFIGLTMAITRIGTRRKSELYILDCKPMYGGSLVSYLLIIGFIGYILLTGFNVSIMKSDKYLKNLSMRSSSKHLSMALTAGKKAVKTNPSNLSALYKLGFVYLSQGKSQKAYNAYAKILQQSPRYAQIYYNLGLLQADMKNIYKSLDEFKLAATIENNVVNNMRIASSYNKIGLYGPASFYYRRALTLPSYPGSQDDNYKKIGYRVLSQLYLSLNKDNKAVNILKTMIINNFDKTWALNSLIENMTKRGKDAELTTFLEDLREKSPNNLVLAFLLGNIYFNNKKFENAFNNYNIVLKLVKMNPPPQQRKMLQKIIVFYKDLFVRNRKNAPLADLLGIAYLKIGRASDAKKYFTKALQASPDYTPAKQHIDFLKRLAQ